MISNIKEFCSDLIKEMTGIEDNEIIELLVTRIVEIEYSIGGGGNNEHTICEVTKQVIKMYYDGLI